MKLLLDIPVTPGSEGCEQCPYLACVEDEGYGAGPDHCCRIFGTRLWTQVHRDLGPPVTQKQRQQLPEWARNLPTTNETSTVLGYRRCKECLAAEAQAKGYGKSIH